MNSLALGLYHRLPYFARSAAAALRGAYLERWRYGPETGRLVEEALERERWPEERWQSWRQERLAYVLHRAATRVPCYAEHWAERRRRGDRASWEYLENWPVLEKEAVRRRPRAFVAEDCDIRAMFRSQTSGTTGTPLQIWYTRPVLRAWYALFEARARRWHGVSRNDRWGILGGQLVVRVEQRRPPYWIWNAAMRQLYLSSYHLSPDCLPHYLDAIERFAVSYLYGYPSALHALAMEALRQHRRSGRLSLVLTNAEVLFSHQRAAIREAFGCPVRETYGMAELVCAAGECELGGLHWWPEVGWVEQAPEGDLLVTSLLNADSPLVRYRIGDRGAAPANGGCGCGRTLPLSGGIEGRSDDVLYTRDGRPVGRLDPVFKAALPIREAQVVQESLDRVRVRYVPAPEYTPSAGQTIAGRLRDRLGPVEVVLEAVAAIPRSPNGKFRAVVSQLDRAARLPEPV